MTQDPVQGQTAGGSSEEPPESVQDLADSCVRFVNESLEIALDYTPETLPILDHYMDAVSSNALTDEAIDLLTSCAGAYFGEVVRRSIGGVRWHIASDNYVAYRLEFDRCYLHFNPMGVARAAMLKEEPSGWSANFQILDEDREAVAHVLELAGEVSESDYYRFSIRWEALLLVVQALSEQVVSRGETTRRFGPDVYRAMIDGESPSNHAN